MQKIHNPGFVLKHSYIQLDGMNHHRLDVHEAPAVCKSGTKLGKSVMAVEPGVYCAQENLEYE